MLNCDPPPPPETGGLSITTPPTDKIWTPVELRPRVFIPRSIDPGHDSTLNCDPGFGSQSMWNSDPGSYFNVAFWSWSLFHVELWPRIIIPRWIVTRVYGELCIGTKFHGELWPWVLIPLVWISRWILTPSHDSSFINEMALWSQFNLEFWLGS